MPSLASQSKAAIVEAMKKFKSGERFSTISGEANRVIVGTRLGDPEPKKKP